MGLAQPVQFPVSSQPGQAWGGQFTGEEQVTFLNLDPTNTCFLGNTNNFSPNTNSVPVTPNSSITVPANKPWWVSGAPGTFITVIPGSIQYTPGKPLLSALGNVGVTAIPAATTFPLVSLIDVSQFTSFEISLYVYNISQSTVGAALTCPVQLLWYDDLVSGIPVYQEEWDIWVANNSGGGIVPPLGTAFGYGPMHGRYMTITVTEPGGVNAINLLFGNVYGGQRSFPKSNFQQSPPIMSNNGISYGNPTMVNSATAFNNILVECNNSSPGLAGTFWIANGLFAGNAWWRFQPPSAGILAHDVCLSAADPSTVQSGSMSAGVSTPGVIYDASGSSGSTPSETQVMVVLPRCPTYTVFQFSSLGSISQILIGAQ